MQVVPQGIESVNGSSVNMGCTSSLVDSGGVLVCESRSFLVDGCSPDINTSTSDWASQLVTVRRSNDGPGINFPHVLLTFGFDTAVSLTGIEMDWFLCPDWGIGAPSIRVYINPDYNLNLVNINIYNLPFVVTDDNSLQSSCDSLSTVTFSGGSLVGSYYRTFHIIVTLSAHPSIEWVHVGEVRFIGIDSPTYLQPSPPLSLPPPEPLPPYFFTSLCEFIIVFLWSEFESFTFPSMLSMAVVVVNNTFSRRVCCLSVCACKMCRVCLHTLCAICLLVAIVQEKRVYMLLLFIVVVIK